MAAEAKREPLRRVAAGGRLPPLGLWLAAYGIFKSPMAIYRRSIDFCACFDAFTASSCSIPVERAQPGYRSATRGYMKVVLWALTTLLAAIFSYKVAAVMPVPVQVLVWAMAGATFLGGFCALFLLHRQEKIMNGAVDDTTFTNERFRIMMLAAPQTDGDGSHAAEEDPRDAAWAEARLIVDSGAMMHATGNDLLLVDYQAYNLPTVARQADGSGLRVLGVGRIRRGSFSIPNVFHVEGVQDVLISIPQLDSRHHLVSFFGNGECTILEADGITVVGRAMLQQTGYVLSSLYVPQPAQLRRIQY